MQTKPLILALLAGLAVSGAAQATLINRGGGLLYDDVLDITWLQDANYAMTQFFASAYQLGDPDGRMTWQESVDWAANLSYYDSVRGVTYDDWRLPSVLGENLNYGWSINGSTDFGNNTIRPHSELAWMFYANLGLKGTLNSDGTYNQNFGIIGADLGFVTNLQSSMYWYGTEYAPDTNDAINFTTFNGVQGWNVKSAGGFAWAVRPGDVAAAQGVRAAPRGVPEPETLGLLAIGLLGLGLARRRG